MATMAATINIVTTLFPPKLSHRPRSLSNVSLASSRPCTPAPSTAPSTPNSSNLSPRSTVEIEQPPILDVFHRILWYLDARDILSISATTRRCRKLLSSLHFQRNLALNGWDTEALVRRMDEAKEVKGCEWMFLARSALDKGDILKNYASLPKEGDKKASATDKKAVEKFMRVLVDVATEHDRRNFKTLNRLANAIDMNLIQFVTAIQANDWKMRYRKTFVIAAFINAQPLCPEAEKDLEPLAETIDFDNPKPPLSFVATRANFLYIYGCISRPVDSPTTLSSIDYDPPHLCSSKGASLPGLQQAVNRFAHRTVVKGFYHKSSGSYVSHEIEFQPKGLASKSSPFTFKDHNRFTLTATVTDGDGNTPWEMDGFIDRKTGVGKLKDSRRLIMYELWTTPWGVTGQKIRGEGKHLGYFVLHWT